MKKWFIPVLAALAGAAVSSYFYNELPEQMAIHFGPSDEPDNYAHKAFALFLQPAIILFVAAVTTFSSRLEPDESKRKRFSAGNETVIAVVSVVMLAVHLFTIAYNLGHEISPTLFAALAAGVTFIAVGNIAPTMPQGTLRLFRIKDQNYAKYARFQGRLLVVGGFLLLLSTLLPASVGMYLFLFVIAVVIISVFGGAFYYNR